MPLTQPPAESCIVRQTGCFCFDPRISKAPPGASPMPCEAEPLKIQGITEGVCYRWTLAQCQNYPATNAIDYKAKQDWIQSQCFGPPKR